MTMATMNAPRRVLKYAGWHGHRVIVIQPSRSRWAVDGWVKVAECGDVERARAIATTRCEIWQGRGKAWELVEVVQ